MKKKFLMIALFALVCCVAFTFANTVSAAEDEFATVEDIKPSDTYRSGDPIITGNGTSNITVTYDSSILYKEVVKDLSQGRTVDGGWIGVRVIQPKKYSKQEIDNKSKYRDIVDKIEKDFYDNRDSKEEATVYLNSFYLLSEATLKLGGKGDKICYVTEFDWDGNGDYEQKVTIVIKPSAVTLLSKDSDDTEIWNEDIYLENSDQVKVTYSVVYDINKNGGAFGFSKYYDKDTKITEADTKKLIEESGLDTNKYVVEGFYTDSDMKNKFDFNTALNNSISMYVKIVDKPVTNTTTNNKKDTTPKTGSVDMVMYIAIAVAVVSLAGAVMTKKALNK